jgi:glycosyltransferase involved in cell wall biosynthesis
MKSLKNGLRAMHPRQVLKRVLKPMRNFGERYSLEDNTEVTLYTDQPAVFPGYFPVHPLHGIRQRRSVKVTLVATARNERENAQRLFDSFMQQNRLPDEIIVIDTGSTDGTAALLHELAVKSRVSFKVLSEKGANIARGRNLAIRQASHPVIAVTDFGCEMGPEWLEALLAPFEADPLLDVAAGRYEAVDQYGKPARWLLGRTLEQIDPQAHLPSAVSIAFRKEAWHKVGGYPEWLTLTGEDTYFALELKRSTQRWAFVPDAVVKWEAPTNVKQYLRKAYTWSIGDGESGTTARSYRWAGWKIFSLLVSFSAFLLILAAGWYSGSIWLLLILFFLMAAFAAGYFLRIRKRGSNVGDFFLLTATYTAEIIGFLKGYSRRRQVDLRRFAGLKGIFFILASVPIDDTGGGARWTQIALELIRQQYLVVFLNKFPKYESVELDLRICHPNLINEEVSKFSWTRFSEKFWVILEQKPISALVEIPLEDYLPIIAGIRGLGGVVVYDLLDDWDTALGGQWYRKKIELSVVASSQLLSATAPRLLQRLEHVSGRPVVLLPNAVNRLIFNPARCYQPPPDLPAAEWYAIYVGALWGEWFDWELLVQSARAYPSAAVVVIGDYHGQCPDPPANLHFLGLKAQRDLPAYLAHARVTIVPWKVNEITQATSPLKVYEYLAMQKPVLAPNIQPLQNIPGVFLAADSLEFIEKMGSLNSSVLQEYELEQFIKENDWQARVKYLLSLIDTYREQY